MFSYMGSEVILGNPSLSACLACCDVSYSKVKIGDHKGGLAPLRLEGYCDTLQARSPGGVLCSLPLFQHILPLQPGKIMWVP